jgi:hypothetical protein
LLVDAITLALGECWFDAFLRAGSPPSEADAKQFWQRATEQVMRYRDQQWAFYSTYRALFLLLLPGWGVLSWLTWKHIGYGYALIVASSLILLEVGIYFAARCLLKLNYSLTKQFS